MELDHVLKTVLENWTALELLYYITILHFERQVLKVFWRSAKPTIIKALQIVAPLAMCAHMYWKGDIGSQCWTSYI